MSCVAQPVNVDKVSLANPAAVVDPRDVLKGRQLAIYNDIPNRVLPLPPPGFRPRGCLMTSPQEEIKLRRKMFECGMGVLVLEAELPLNEQGRPLLAGAFMVDGKRLIFDKRPTNFDERRFFWAHLPLGCQLVRLVLANGFGIRGSGDDLKAMFYQLLEHPGLLSRYAFGRRVTGDEAGSMNGVSNVDYRMCLNVIAMGGLNSVDIAQNGSRVNPVRSRMFGPGQNLEIWERASHQQRARGSLH